ncbi:MAG: hypothetical protein EOM55_02910 [Clostridia bacterium]|nr:hypothetical protein [Clostridia bacterium]
MKIKEWENLVYSKYIVRKLNSFEEIKEFLSYYFDIKSDFKLAYRCGLITYYIYLKNEKEFQIISFQQNGDNNKTNFTFDYDKFINLYYSLRKTKNFENYRKCVNEQLNLKAYNWDQLTNEEQGFFTKFTTVNIETLTESEISEENFYAAYQFEEKSIAKREVFPTLYMGLNTTIVFLESKDKIKISNFCLRDSGGLSQEELNLFYNDINPLTDGKVKL